MKAVEVILNKQLKRSTEEEKKMKQLEGEFRSVSSKYDELKSRVEASIISSVSSKTIQYEILVKDLGMQVSKLLYENTKLRQHIEKDHGHVLLPLNPDLICKENLSEANMTLFESIQQLMIQNRQLKENQIKIAVHSQNEAPKSKEGNEQEVKNLMKRIEAADLEMEKLRESRDNWKTQANNLIKTSSDIHRQLRSYQQEKVILEQNHKHTVDALNKYKNELENIEKVTAPSDVFIAS